MNGDHSPPQWDPMSTMSTPSQGWEPAAPHLDARAAPFPRPFPQPPYGLYNNADHAAMLQNPNVLHQPFGNNAGRPPYPYAEEAHHVYYPPSMGIYPQPRLPSALRSRPPPGNPNMSGWGEAGSMPPFNPGYYSVHNVPGTGPSLPMPPCPGRPGGFGAPSYPPLLPNSGRANADRLFAMDRRPPTSHLGWAIPTPPGPDGGSAVRPRPGRAHNRRPSQQESSPRNSQPTPHTDRSFQQRASILAAHYRRGDRSVSPLSSARRSFDRYSYDSGLDVDEAAARVPPSNRARRLPRDVRAQFFGHPPHHDPNLATPQQIQELKNRLSRRLLSELPEKASRECDICAKEYSSTHVQPAEEQEVAVELSCGHYFGEFCLFEWVGTVLSSCDVVANSM
jgi:hypothetical protein